MKIVFSTIAVIAGVIISGQCAIWGALLGGHDPSAGDPFPDFKGAILFLIGLTLIPLGVVFSVTLTRRIFSSRLISVYVPIPVAILLLSPLLSLATGYSVQALDNRKKKEEKEFYLRQEASYSSYAAHLVRRYPVTTKPHP